jgi:hypothetical protein
MVCQVAKPFLLGNSVSVEVVLAVAEQSFIFKMEIGKEMPLTLT